MESVPKRDKLRLESSHSRVSDRKPLTKERLE